MDWIWSKCSKKSGSFLGFWNTGKWLTAESQENAVMALVQVEGLSFSGLRSGAPSLCGIARTWGGLCPSAFDWRRLALHRDPWTRKEKERCTVSELRRERESSKPWKVPKIEFNYESHLCIYSCFVCRPLASWTYEKMFVSIIAIGLESFDFPLHRYHAECILFILDTEDSNIQGVKIGRLVKCTLRKFLLLSGFQGK